MTVAIGLDVGGTKMAAGLVDRRGQVLLRSEIPTRVAEGGGRVLERALAQALAEGVTVTDEAMAVERLGRHPRLVEGREDNLKVTTPADLALAEFLLARRSA